MSVVNYSGNHKELWYREIKETYPKNIKHNIRLFSK